MEEKLTHFDEKGNAIMVDVTEKKITSRTATASGKIHVNEAVMKAVLEGTVAKGDVLGVARVAGIMAVKQTAHLIPMCHTLLITKCSVDFEVDEKELTIKALCTAKLEGKTGVEMEALTGVSVDSPIVRITVKLANGTPTIRYEAGQYSWPDEQD